MTTKKRGGFTFADHVGEDTAQALLALKQKLEKEEEQKRQEKQAPTTYVAGA